jgi:hypothetical protein
VFLFFEFLGPDALEVRARRHACSVRCRGATSSALFLACGSPPAVWLEPSATNACQLRYSDEIRDWMMYVDVNKSPCQHDYITKRITSRLFRSLGHPEGAV